MQTVAERLNKQWGGASTAVHFIPEYYAQDMWSYAYLKTLGVYQQPDVRSAARAGVHDDYHYEAIMATVDPQTIRTAQRLAVGLYSVNGFDMSPPGTTLENGTKLIAYRAQLTVAAIRQAIAKRRATKQ